MNVDKQQIIQELLSKYVSGNMSVEELAHLKQVVNVHSDEELATCMHVVWQQFGDTRQIDLALQQKMLAKIKQRTTPNSLSIFRRRGLSIAASIIIIIMTSLSSYLFYRNHEMTQLADRNIVVKVGKGERVSITLLDGTKVRLNSESELSYQQDFGLEERKVSLDGEAFFDVAHNAAQTFTVKTQFMDIKVLGTAFNVYTYQNSDSVEMALVRGKVEVTTTRPPYQTIHVKPDEKVVYNKKTGKMRLESSSNQLAIAWVSHELVFRSADLKEVLNRIGRKYGFIIEINDEHLLSEKYTGVFDETEVCDVMNILKSHFGFTYRIKENTIWIERK